MIKKIPSLIDMHVHLREPGFTHKETIETGLNSAIKGGYGAILAMPNTNPVCDSKETVKEILEISKKLNKDIEVYPVGAVTKNLNTDILVDFKELKNAGCIAFSNDGMSTRKTKEALLSNELILSHLEDETKEAIEALVALGYPRGAASLAVGKLDASLPASELIKQALKTLARRV